MMVRVGLRWDDITARHVTIVVAVLTLGSDGFDPAGLF